MSGTTRKRHSPAVYRRRRLVLLLALVVIGGLVWLFIAQPWSSADGDDGGSTQQTSEQATTTDLPSPEEGAATPGATPESTEPAPTPSSTSIAEPCVARDITVEPVTDKDSYGSGQNPQLSIRLTNTGEDCTMNVGTAAQAFTITSGSDTWWRSTDCQAEPSDMVVLIEAGQTVESASPIEWDRTRSAVGTCDADDRPRAPGGGSSYNLSVEIGGISSTQAKLFLLY